MAEVTPDPTADNPSTDHPISETHEPGLRSLLGLITDIQNGLAKRFRTKAKHIGLSRPQWRVLTTLTSRPGLTQTELAELVGIGRAPAGKIVDKLEAMDWVERRADPDDRRVNRLYLTRSTASIAEPTQQISNEVVDELLADLPEEEVQMFRKTLEHLHEKLGFIQTAGLIGVGDAAALDEEE